MPSPQVIVITGPTATGKSAIGALLAKSIGGEVISADSMQIYKYMDIGTAKPTKDERLGVPHHMLDIVHPCDDYSTAAYVEDASAHIDDILRRGKRPIIVGGTGLYIDSVISGRTFSLRGDANLRKGLEDEYDSIGGELMLQRLQEIDPESAKSLHHNDKKRIVRAFEVYQTAGEPISRHNQNTKSQPPRYSSVKVILMYSDRKNLYSKIDARVDYMLGSGFLEEVRSLIGMGVPPGSTAMQAIGYKELAEVIYGQRSIDDAVDKIKMESRRYAKRQLTWLRRDAEAVWVFWEDEVPADIPDAIWGIVP